MRRHIPFGFPCSNSLSRCFWAFGAAIVVSAAEDVQNFEKSIVSQPSASSRGTRRKAQREDAMDGSDHNSDENNESDEDVASVPKRRVRPSPAPFISGLTSLYALHCRKPPARALWPSWATRAMTSSADLGFDADAGVLFR